MYVNKNTLLFMVCSARRAIGRLAGRIEGLDAHTAAGCWGLRSLADAPRGR
jgi:hypothetical protein